MDEPSWTAAGVAPLRIWRSDGVIASPEPQVGASPSLDEVDKRLALERRAEAAERDRDWWISQHDAVMQDWRADMAQAAQLAAVSQASATPMESAKSESALVAELSAVLANLLKFYDAQDGSILFQKDALTLSDAFKQASVSMRLMKR